jgi:hypothetical protein
MDAGDLTPELAKAPVTHRFLIDVVGEIAGVTREAIKHATAPLHARISTLERHRLPKWAGVWEAKGYQEGNLVTRSGALWLAMRDTSDRPGETTSAWRLIAKSGSSKQGDNAHGD